MRCQICGHNTSSKIEINDPEFSVFGSFAHLFKECFDVWVSGRTDRLYIKIKEKIRGSKDE